VTPADRPVVTIVHSLAGRVRFRLSHPVADAEALEDAVRQHAGIESVRYTPATRSLLVHHEPGQVAREEIAVRVGLALSLAHGTVPVRLLTEPEAHETSDLAFYSGFTLVAAMATRVLRIEAAAVRRLDWAAGLATAGAVLEHGWRELRRRGNFDPEVLSLVYLLTRLVRGNLLPAAIFTWATTFGRHLVRRPSSGVELRPVQTSSPGDGPPHYEVVVGPDASGSDKMDLFRLLPAVAKYALTGRAGQGGPRLLEEIRSVSRLHGEVLEGLGSLRRGIPLRIR
jgi:hypothetical protein